MILYIYASFKLEERESLEAVSRSRTDPHVHIDTVNLRLVTYEIHFETTPECVHARPRRSRGKGKKPEEEKTDKRNRPRQDRSLSRSGVWSASQLHPDKKFPLTTARRRTLNTGPNVSNSEAEHFLTPELLCGCWKVPAQNLFRISLQNRLTFRPSGFPLKRDKLAPCGTGSVELTRVTVAIFFLH